MTYDQWKLATPPEYEWPSGPDADPKAEDRSRIDDMMQTAKTAKEWLAICDLCKSIGDEPPFHFDYSPYEQMVAVTRSDWDLGMPSGMGRTELAAIADLLEQEDDQ
jgi:hypothetical protein